jgi:hypothetical protein
MLNIYFVSHGDEGSCFVASSPDVPLNIYAREQKVSIDNLECQKIEGFDRYITKKMKPGRCYDIDIPDMDLFMAGFGIPCEKCQKYIYINDKNYLIEGNAVYCQSCYSLPKYNTQPVYIEEDLKLVG